MAKKKEEKAINDLAMATEITTLGFNYWKKLLETALSQKLLTGPEQAILRQAMQIASSGMIPCSCAATTGCTTGS